MVPSSIQDDDLSVVIDRHHLIIGVKDHPPIVQGRMYSTVDTASSVWQLEHRNLRQPSMRERTISSASTASTHSSYAFVSSDPDISSSFAASLESAQASDAEETHPHSPAPSSPNLTYADDGLFRLQKRKLDPNPVVSRSVSPGQTQRSMASSLSSLDSTPSPKSGRLLTVHLEKEQSIIWPTLIVGPAPGSLASSLTNTVVIFDENDELEEQYEMDSTSLALIGLEFCDIRKDKESAFEYFLRAWRKAHVPSATMRLVSHYLPSDQVTPSVLSELSEKPVRGTFAYYVKSIGGTRGLAQLYLEAGLLHLEGAASTLLAASYSSLSSIRIPLHAQIGEGGAAAWRRDREAAAKFFDSARALYPGLDIPALPAEGELELEMPTMNLVHPASDSEPLKEEFLTDSEPDAALRRRRKALEREHALMDKSRSGLDDMDGPWYLYVPGIIGAGTAILVVGIVGALSFSTWSRRNQGS